MKLKLLFKYLPNKTIAINQIFTDYCRVSTNLVLQFLGSVAEWVKASFLQYDDSDRRIMSSTRTLVTLLRPWIRRFTIFISAWWLRTSCKFTWKEVKTSTGKLGKSSTPKRVRIRPKHSAPSLSRDRRIKMHQSINQSILPYISQKNSRLANSVLSS